MGGEYCMCPNIPCPICHTTKEQKEAEQEAITKYHKEIESEEHPSMCFCTRCDG